MDEQPNGDYEDILDLPEELQEILQMAMENKSGFLATVERGRKGDNAGWPTSLPKLDATIHGIHRGRYYLVGADSGVGKTTLSDFIFLLQAYEYAKTHGKKFYCYYYSFELSKQEKLARWVSYYIYLKYGRMYPSNFIMGRIHGNYPDDTDMKYIRAGYAYVSKMGECIAFREDSMHPTAIFMDVMHHYNTHGTVHRDPPAPGKEYGAVKGYDPNPGEQDSLVMFMVDHVALVHSERSMDTKQTIDLLSRYAVATRNLFNATWVIIQQFSTDMQSWHRNAKKMSDAVIAPQRLDFGDSKYTYRDADVVLGLVSPRMFELDSFHGYKVEDYGDFLIGLYVMKHRYGLANTLIPLFMNPVVNRFEQLPASINLAALEDYQDKTSQIETICQKYSPREA